MSTHTCKRNPSDAGPETEQRRCIAVHRAFRGDHEQTAALHDREGVVERSLVPPAAPDRDLVVPAQDRADHATAEELRSDQEPALTLDPSTQLDREDRSVERAHVVEREDRRPAQRDVLDPGAPDAEDDPDERDRDREAGTPPAVQLAPAHGRHASVRADGRARDP